MTLWIVFAALTLGVLALLVISLLRHQVVAPARVDYDMVVYRDQLAEVERDVERGLLSAEQAEAARTEILRRMLAAEDAELRAPMPDYRMATGRRLRLGAALVILIGLPAGAFGVYATLGMPGLPGQPFAARQADPEVRMTQMAAGLAADLKVMPEPDGYATLANTYFTLGRYEEAADAFRQAIRLGAISAEMLASLAELIVLVNDGSVVPEAREAFLQALTLDHTDPRARFYLGLAKAQLGKYAEAVSIWRDLEKDSPAEAPWLPMLKEHIAEFARQGGFDPVSIKPVPPAPAGPKTAGGPNPHGEAEPPTATTAEGAGMPSGDAAAAVMAAPPEERDKIIRSMVETLAARLEQSPDDLEGWMRLARSYKTLGDLDKAKTAAQRAVRLKPREVEPKLALAEIQLAAAKGGQLPGDFIATMKDVLALEPGNAEAMYYVGAAEAQAGRPDGARQLWSKLLELLPPDSPNRPELVKQLGALPKN